MVHIQIIHGEVRELVVAEKDLVAIPPGTELIFESTIDAFAKIAKKTSSKLIDDLVAEKSLSDKRKK